MGDSVRVLYVDDPGLVARAATGLGRADARLTVETATSVDEALGRVDDADCVVSAYDLSDGDGVDFLGAVRERDPDRPFILFTDAGSEAVASEAISAGVTDYVRKDAVSDPWRQLADRVVDAADRSRDSVDYRAIFEHSPDGIVVQNPDGSFVDMNDAYADLFGYDREAFLEADFEAVHPDEPPYTLDHAREQIRDALESGPRTFEWPGITSDGEQFWTEVHLTPIRLDGADRVLATVRDVTERKERERELQRAERRYRAILDDPNILAGLLDPDGTVLDVNETALAYVDAPREAVIGVPFWGTPWFAQADAARAGIKTRIDRAASGEYVEFEADLTGADGTVHAIEGVFRPVASEDEVVSIVVSAREVTERKERERELERIRDFFMEAERLGNLGAWEYDADDNVVWTEGTRRIHGVDDDFEPTVAAGLDFIHPDDRDRVASAVEAAMEMGEPYDIEARLITASGDTRWIRARGEPVDTDGTTVRGYIQDITDQKERERQLREAKSQLEAAIEAGALGTWGWSIPEDRVVVDRAFAETFGIDPDAAADGVPIDRFLSAIHEEDRDRVEDAIDAALDDCGEYAEEFRVRDAVGDFRWVVARGNVECDESGAPVTFPGTLTDITERKAYEQRLERQNERLETFASVVSHDLRNPLTVAQGRLQLARLACTCDCDEFDAIERAHERMRALIDDLLTLARQGEGVDDTEPVHLSSVVASCWRTVDTTNADLIVDTDLIVEADRSRLQQLLENLIRNAIEHGSAGSRLGADDAVEYRSTGNRTQSGDAVEHGPDDDTVTITIGDLDDGFYVADDGPGIPESERETVFEAGHTTREGGTGFGLSIVEQIADAHGWSVAVTASDTGGARFEITGVERVDPDAST
ncbi:PAS domain S-box protein [Haloplanus aerogenes]|uniref:histidine kinase n=1 Tax=Haloplanus aerogenes TaxID=660522 RepID=A0A3M0CYJ5_9EURY|nr:PAS domain S-box protein [Haloplanus aerogenes]AZH24887.1 PAS domain S-box protein [Haloplanus aerogenes]RMB13904.1 PAS domain S-box-containing protein [Haloplanus aerogenes]